MFNCIILILILYASSAIGQDLCRTPNGDAGTCILLENCEPLRTINEIEKKSPEDLLFLRQAHCGLFMNMKPKVCCPPKDQWNAFTTNPPVTFPSGSNTPPYQPPTIRPPPVDNNLDNGFWAPPITHQCKPTLKPPLPESLCCGKEDGSSDRIIGGDYAGINQYPWMALLEYDNSAAINVCGGTLISSRYVLTAAHCLGKTVWGTPIRVRLAEYNTTSYPTDEVEANGGGVEYITVVIIGIERQIPHPNYKRYVDFDDDIGLVKLSRNAPYSAFIRPICLPLRDVTTLPLEILQDLRFWAAGWGIDGYKLSDVKKDVSLPYVSREICQIPYLRQKSKRILKDTQICAGGEKDQDTCAGDSGGPLMYEAGDTYVLVGVVSFGHTTCGTEGTPGVYTHVYKYLDWIVKNMT